MEIDAVKTVKVQAKTLAIYIKVVDTFEATLKDQDGNDIKDYEGYVPEFMPNNADGSSHFGDYLILDIDIDTGKIINWIPPTKEQIEEFIYSTPFKFILLF